MKSLFYISLLFVAPSILAQSVLEEAKALNNKGKYTASIKVLKPYVETHKDVNTLWLYGQTLHLGKRYKKAQKIYEEAIAKSPNNTYLELDFATKLAENQKFDKAIAILTPYANKKGETQFFATKELAKIYLWQGKYDLAKLTIDKALSLNSSDAEALSIADAIAQIRKNWMGADFMNFSDDQPQKRFSPEAEVGFYLNDKISVGGVVHSTFYNADEVRSNKFGVRSFAYFNLYSIRASSKVNLGIDKLPSGESAVNTSFLFTKRVTKCLNIEVSTSYKPYLLTNVSLQQKLMQTEFGGALVLNHPLGFSGRLLYNASKFPAEDNGYITKGGWLLSPQLKLSVLELSAGYGYSYSDAEKSNFVSKESVSTIVANWEPNLVIDGYYNPFFTPINQTIHSVIGVLGINFTSAIKLSTTVSYGFKSTTDNPYLYLGKGKYNEIIIKTGYENMEFSPMDVKVNLSYKATKDLSFKAYYKYQKANFYISNLVGVKVNYLF